MTDTQRDSDLPSLPAALASPRRRWAPQFIWIIPIIAVPVSYTHLDVYKRQVLDLAKTSTQPPLTCLCVEAAAIGDVDFSAAAMLRDSCNLLRGKGIRLVFANVSTELRGQFDRYGISKLLGEDAIYGSVHAVVAAYEGQSVPEPTTVDNLSLIHI